MDVVDENFVPGGLEIALASTLYALLSLTNCILLTPISHSIWDLFPTLRYRMAIQSNSSVRRWLTMDTPLWPLIQPCRIVIHIYLNDTPTRILSYAQVCNDSLSLLYTPTNNSATCDLFTTLAAISMDNGVMKPFQDVGLNASNATNVSMYADNVSYCLLESPERSNKTLLLLTEQCPSHAQGMLFSLSSITWPNQ